MAEVARRAGVAPMTVSRALSHHPAVSPATRERVMKAARLAGYRPNSRLRRLIRTMHNKTRTVGLLCSHSILKEIRGGNAYQIQIRSLVALQAELQRADGYLLMADADQDILPDNTPRCVANGMVDGIIVQSSYSTTVEVAARLVPVVLFNFEAKLPRVDVVLPDAEGAAVAQLDLLRQQGHTRIACFRCRPIGSPDWQDRRFWAAYERWHVDQGISLPPAYLEPIRFGYNEHPAAIAVFLDRVLACGHSPTAIVTYDVYADEMAAQLAGRSLQVPRDIGLIGFDDIMTSLASGVGLTSFRQDFEAMARITVQMLMERIEEPDLPARLVEVEGKLVVRNSTQAREVGATGGASLTT